LIDLSAKVVYAFCVCLITCNGSVGQSRQIGQMNELKNIRLSSFFLFTLPSPAGQSENEGIIKLNVIMPRETEGMEI
jgi:hypothetical protein